MTDRRVVQDYIQILSPTAEDIRNLQKGDLVKVNPSQFYYAPENEQSCYLARVEEPNRGNGTTGITAIRSDGSKYGEDGRWVGGGSDGSWIINDSGIEGIYKPLPLEIHNPTAEDIASVQVGDYVLLSKTVGTSFAVYPNCGFGRVESLSNDRSEYYFDCLFLDSLGDRETGDGVNGTYRVYNDSHYHVLAIVKASGAPIMPIVEQEENREIECDECERSFPRNEVSSCGMCRECCQEAGHYTCTRCNERERRQATRDRRTVIHQCNGEDSVCERCECCENHCDCTHCGRCGEVCNDNYCGNCGRCFDCCEGHECSSCECDPCECYSQDRNAGEAFHATKRQRTQFDCARTVGVEIEYNRKSLNTRAMKEWYDNWRAGDHPDGSCGREIVTAPLAGDHLVRCLNDLGDALSDANAEADERCGVHVHVDASDYRWHDMYRLLYVYGKVEPLLYLLAGQHRLTNEYCQPCGSDYLNALENSAEMDFKGKKEAVLSVAYASDEGGRGSFTPRENVAGYIRRYKPRKRDGGRYRGLNICPWLAGRREHQARKNFIGYFKKNKKQFEKYGRTHIPARKDSTVEFRIHRNTLDTDRILGWSKLCCRIVDWCAKATDKEVAALPKSALKILAIVAPDCKDWILSRIKSWRNTCTAQSGAYRHNAPAKPQRRVTVKNGMFVPKEDIYSIRSARDCEYQPSL